MDKNKYNFVFEGSESWMLLTLLAMASSNGRSFMQADKNTLDEFTIEQLRAAAMNKKETDKLRLSSMYGNCMDKEHKEIEAYKRELEETKKELKRRNDEDIKENEPDDYRGLYGRSWDV